VKPTEKRCPHRQAESGVEFWCARFESWFLTDGLECRRCQAGLPVTTEAYRQYLAGQLQTGKDLTNANG